jgi:hypothetical protein
MISPPVALVFVGGVLVAPIVGIACAWIGQRRYRRARGLFLEKPAAAAAPLPADGRPKLALVLGIVAALLTTVATLPGGRLAGIAPVEVLLRWVGLVGVAAALAAAVRLARVGMPPEPNFRLDAGVGGEIPGKSVAPAAADLLDAREF